MGFFDSFKEKRDLKRRLKIDKQKFAITKVISGKMKTIGTFEVEPDDTFILTQFYNDYGGGDYFIFFTKPSRKKYKTISVEGEPKDPEIKLGDGEDRMGPVLQRTLSKIDSEVEDRVSKLLLSDRYFIERLAEDRLNKVMDRLAPRSGELEELRERLNIIEGGGEAPPKWLDKADEKTKMLWIWSDQILPQITGAVHEYIGVKEEADDSDLYGRPASDFDVQEEELPELPPRKAEKGPETPSPGTSPPQEPDPPPQEPPADVKRLNELVDEARIFGKGLNTEQKKFIRIMIPRIEVAIKEKIRPSTWTKKLMESKIYKNVVRKRNKEELIRLALGGWKGFYKEYGKKLDEAQVILSKYLQNPDFAKSREGRSIIKILRAWTTIKSDEGKRFINGVFKAVLTHYKIDDPKNGQNTDRKNGQKPDRENGQDKSSEAGGSK